MTDCRLREAQRAATTGGAEAQMRLIVERMRAGDLSRERVAFAAGLGHQAARLIVPDADPLVWGWESNRWAIGKVATIRLAAEVTDWPTIVAWGADIAERALPVWEEFDPEDRTPRRAIQAVRRWLDQPSKRNAGRCSHAYAHADSASEQASCSGNVRAMYAAMAAADIADGAWFAHSLIYAGDTAVSPVQSIRSTTDVARVLGNTVIEDEWQRERLLAYVLGET